MKAPDINEAVARIERMEQVFDTLCSAAERDPEAVYHDHKLSALLTELVDYYDGGQWLRDYELDEKGVFPKDLKRGVLSQDGVFDFLALICRSDD